MVASDHSSSFSWLRSLLASRGEVERLCGRIAAAGQGMTYAGHEVHIHNLRMSETPHGRNRMVLHTHSYFEALFIAGGRGREDAGFDDALVPGTTQLHAPGMRHGWSSPEGTLVRFGVCFTLKPPVDLRPIRKWPVIPELADELEALFREARGNDPGAASRIRARFVLVLSRFFALPDWPETELPHPEIQQRPLAETVEQFLRDNLSQPLTLDDVAQVAHTSVPTLNRRYREETGHSVMGRFNVLRMEEAAHLLRGTDLTVREVGERVGFADASYFCRRFRKAHGCSPGVFRAAFSRRG